MTQDKVAEVFVSYNRKDRDDVEHVVRRLQEEASIRVWFDRHDLIPGKTWQKDLEQAVDASDVFAIFLGPNGTGNWQDAEIQCANDKSVKDPQIRVIPVLLPGAPAPQELPPLLRLRDCIDFTGRDGLSDETEFRRLVSGIRNQSPNGVEEAGAKEKSRKALLHYYETQEANCEQLVFASRQDKVDIKGSELYVQLHLLTERIEQLSSQTTSNAATGTDQVSRSQKPKRSLFGLRKSSDNDQRKETTNDEPQRTKERESWETIFRDDGLRLVFIGGAGSGKSFSLTQEIRKRLSKARKQLAASRPLNEIELPILVKASVLAASSQERISDALLASVSESTLSASPHFINWWRRAFESERGRRLFVVIDGLDELSDEHEQRFRTLMKELDTFESASIIISCRSMYLGSRRDWIGWAHRRTRVIEIAPLDEEQQRQMVENWFANDDVQRETLQSLLKTNYAVRLSCRTPLVLTLVCWIYTTTDRLSGSLSYSSLYQIVTEELLLGRWRDPSKRPAWTLNKSQVDLDRELQDRIALISRTVWKLFEESQSENRFTVRQWRKASSQISTLADTDVNPQVLLDELERVGLLIDAGSSHGERYYSFAHRTLLEYFAALGLLEQDDTWIETLVKHMWCESGWEEVIRFAASKTEKPGRLLNRMAQETGYAVTPWRLLELLGVSCKTIAVLSIGVLLLILASMGLFIGSSPELQAQLKEGGFHYFQTLRATSLPELTDNPLQIIKAHGDVLLNLYTGFRESTYKLILNSSNSQKHYIHLLLPLSHYLFVRILVLLPVIFLGVFLSWLASSILYRITFLKQDDIFRTGLRLQAEVVGFNAATPEKDVLRVVKELLASERRSSKNIYDSTEEGCIPESLLLLVGGNDLARQLLIENFWLKAIDQRTKWLRRLNSVYRHILSCYAWFLLATTKADTGRLLKPDDLQDVRKFCYDFYLHERKLALYIGRKLPAGTQNILEHGNFSDQSSEQFRALIKDLNGLLLGPSLFEPHQFESVDLSPETVALLSREPVGEELVLLNRLLLEDALPGVIRRSQKRWTGFVSSVLSEVHDMMDWLRELRSFTNLSRALRGLSLVTSEQARNPIASLLEVNTLTNYYLLCAKSSTPTFTRLDVYAAKALAILSAPEGMEKLVELANRRSKAEKYRSLALEQLSLIDKRKGIQLAATCLAECSTETSSHLRDGVIEVLRTLTYKQVLDELSKMDIAEEVLFREILIPWLGQEDASTIKTLRKTIAASSHSKSIGNSLARMYLSVSESQLGAARWLEDSATEIGTLLEDDRLDAAAKCFDARIYYYYLSCKSRDVPQALDSFATVCDENLIHTWLLDQSEYKLSKLRGTLARLAQQPNGKAVEDGLIKWASGLNFDRLDKDYKLKVEAVRLLGELGTESAGLTLLAIFQRAQGLRQRMLRLLSIESDTSSFWWHLMAGLTKTGGQPAVDAIQREAKRTRRWHFSLYLVAACSLVEQDSREALRLLLLGHAGKGDLHWRGISTWRSDAGVELQLHDFASRCGARISKVNLRIGVWYIATSQSKNFRLRIRER